MSQQLIEATADGIVFSVRDVMRERQYQKMIGYKPAIRTLDDGAYDDDLSNGLRLTAAVFKAEEMGYFNPTCEQQVMLWRWIVAALFIIEQLEQNGAGEVELEDGTTQTFARYIGKHGAISVYPVTERISLAGNIESVAFEVKREDPYAAAIIIYHKMVEVVGGRCVLSEWGRENLAILHDSFIERLHTNGLPDSPVRH